MPFRIRGCEEVNIDNFNKAHSFCRTLRTKKEDTWHDSFGQYRICLGNNILAKRLNSFKSYSILKDISYCNINAVPGSMLKRGSKYLVSVGSFDVHNRARIECLKNGFTLVTVPVPLANDSFCTNRCSRPKLRSQSYLGVFPSETIIDVSLIKSLPKKMNALGYGEFFGIYFSLIDYCFSRNLALPDALLERVTEWLQELICYHTSNYKGFITSLSTALLFKGLIMRVNKDHQIGCGIDHLLGGVIENKTGLPHGQAVFLGGLLTLQIFPEWEKYGITYAGMQSDGEKLGLVTRESKRKIAALEIDDIVKSALQIRPDRPTMLRTYKER